MNDVGRRRMLHGGAAVVALVFGCGSALAQTTQMSSPEPARPGTTTAQADAAVAQADTVPGELAVPRSSPVADADTKDIVVTGTLLRGIAPTGTNVVGVTRDEITATGASSTNDLLASIPQVGNFGNTPASASTLANSIVRPNIRNLGGSGSNTTLVLVNGHRIVGAGILQTTPDPSAIPPRIIERVEVIPDGGSSIYGSDAIGGVVNFITRKRFDGVEANARYGMADDYKSVDVNLTAGKDWGRGSLFFGYAYSWHDNILRRNRDYASQYRADRGGSDFRSTGCTPGNFTAAGVTYALPGRTRGQNRCDIGLDADLYPREERHSGFMGLTQELSEKLTFETTAYYSTRRTRARAPQTVTNLSFNATNPYFQPVGAETVQNVAFGYENLFGPSNINDSRFDSWGVTPVLTWNVGSGWQARLQGNYGRSYNEIDEDQLDPVQIAAGLAGTTLATALNPYNPSASNAAVLARIENYVLHSQAKQDLAEARLVVDGPLFTLGGGDVRVAMGAEIHGDATSAYVYTGRRNSGDNSFNSRARRNIRSVFGEIFIPLVSSSNAMTLIQGFDISASVRHDDYNDVGGTTNPKVGFNYRPFRGLVIRGNYGTSFNAPSLADSALTIDLRTQVQATSNNRRSDSPASDVNRQSLLLAGGNPNLTPEEATTYSLGADFRPEFVPGLAISATYFNVDYRNAIALAPGNQTLFSDPSFAPYFLINPTLAQLRERIPTNRIEGAASLESLYANGNSPYLFRDARRNNLGQVNIDGIDYSASYNLPTGFGSLNASVAGSYVLNRKAKASATAAEVDNLKNGTRRLSLTGNLGAKVGDFTARGTINLNGSYPVLGVVNQTRVGSFKTVDLFFTYELKQLGLDAASLSVNVDNVFDVNPPFFNNATGFANGSTLGRYVSVSLTTKF